MNFFKPTAKLYANAKNSLAELNSNVTRIRVWKSGYFDNKNQFNFSNPAVSFFVQFVRPDFVGNIGHVSIETQRIYASLWPNHLTILNKYKIQDGVHSSPEIDEQSEGRPPDVNIDLTMLDPEKIEKKLNEFIKTGKYHVIGDNKVFNKGNAHSCSSLALALLVEGGVKEIVPKISLVRDYVVVTPTHVAELVVMAKDKEDELLSIDANSPTNKF